MEGSGVYIMLLARNNTLLKKGLFQLIWWFRAGTRIKISDSLLTFSPKYEAALLAPLTHRLLFFDKWSTKMIPTHYHPLKYITCLRTIERTPQIH